MNHVVIKKLTNSVEANLRIISLCCTHYFLTSVLLTMDYLLHNNPVILHNDWATSEMLLLFTTRQVQFWARLSRWIHRSVTFCETWWLLGLFSWWCADKCQNAETLGRSPFSSGWRLSSGLLQNSYLWAVPCSSGWPSWCYSQYWPDWEVRPREIN